MTAVLVPTHTPLALCAGARLLGRLALAAAALCAAAPAAADSHEFGIDLTVGRTHLREGGHMTTSGVNLSWRPPGWWLGPELGHEGQAIALFLGDRSENTAGLRLELPLGAPGRFMVGGGRAWLREEWVYAATRRSQGWYAHAGVMWPVGSRGFWMGVDARAVRAPAPTDGSWSGSGSADRLALLLAWRI